MNSPNTSSEKPSWQERLCNTTLLWVLFVTTLLATVSFSYLSKKWGITLIDGISSPHEARAVIEQLSAKQRLTHAWITGTLDVLYPFAYALFFAGVTLRCFPKAGYWLIIPILLCIPTDLIEGMIQIFALTDTVDLLNLKAVVTPLKFGLFVFGLAAAIAGGLKWSIGKTITAER